MGPTQNDTRESKTQIVRLAVGWRLVGVNAIDNTAHIEPRTVEDPVQAADSLDNRADPQGPVSRRYVSS